MTLFESLEQPEQQITPEPADILSKILGAKKTNNQRIAQADVTFCTALDASYKAVTAQLTQWKKYLSKDIETNWKGLYSKKENYRGECYELHKNAYKTELDQYRYFPGEELLQVQRNLKEVKAKYASEIMDYFRNAYDLHFTFPDDKLKSFVDYNDVIDHIFTVLPVPSLNDMQEYNLREEFRNWIEYKNRVEVEGSRVNILRTYMLNHRSYTTDAQEQYEINKDSRSSYQTLFKGLSLFENGSSDDMVKADTHEVRFCNFTTKYKIWGKKVEYIKFYKNGKVTLYFVDVTAAQEFHDFYNLSTLKTSRW